MHFNRSELRWGQRCRDISCRDIACDRAILSETAAKPRLFDHNLWYLCDKISARARFLRAHSLWFVCHVAIEFSALLHLVASVASALNAVVDHNRRFSAASGHAR